MYLDPWWWEGSPWYRSVMLVLLSSLALGATPTIAVVGIHAPDLDIAAESDAVTRVAAAIEAGDKFEALDRQEFAASIRGREDIILEDAFMGPGRRPLENGRLLYESANPQEALPVLQEAIEVLSASMATAKSPKDLWEAYVYLGVVSGALDDTAGQKAAFAAAVALAPARNPSSAKFPPDVIEVYDGVRKGVMGRPGMLTINADQPGARIFLNGEEVGVAPVTIQKVFAGTNHVTARGEGGATAYSPITIAQGAAATVDLKLAAPTLGSGGESRLARSRRAGTLYRALGERGNAGLVLLAGTFEGRLYLQLYSAPADGFSTPLSVPLDGDATEKVLVALPTLLDMVNADGTLAVQDQAATAVPLDVGQNPLLASLLLNPEKAPDGVVGPTRNNSGTWVAVGVGLGVVAAGGTAAAILLSGAGQPVENGTIVLNPPQ
jgi:hypothetical protein